MQGLQGDTGDTGPIGPTGPTGTAVTAAYGTFVSKNPQAITAGSAIPLEAVLSSQRGFQFTAGDTFVTALTAGVYQVVYSVRSTTGLGATVSLMVNGGVLPDSTMDAVVGAGQKTGFATVSLAANSTVSIRIDGVNVTLADGTNTFLNLTRIA